MVRGFLFRFVVLLGLSFPGAVQAQTALPDLTIDAARLAQSLDFRARSFGGSDCAVAEGCVDKPGKRILMRFDTGTPNIGQADLFLGDPATNPTFFEFDGCHGHYHFTGYAAYELLTTDGRTIVRGRKQAFCLLDSLPYLAGAGPSHGYHCGYQGITAGWQDVYPKNLDCQWLDVTRVSPGTYLLRVTVNPEGRLLESDYSNNVAVIRVTIPKHVR